ncbi:MAG: glycosyltransferase [Vulcanimicrobiaceae bacterium]|jgi:glycosyltransferase involved in cell wall biosynthesis
MPRRLRICWFGDFFSGFSLAFVNRRLVGALIERDNIDVAIRTDPVRLDRIWPEYRHFATRAARGIGSPDFTIVHGLTPWLHGVPIGSRYIGYYAWEFGAMPQHLYDLREELDDLWTPSHCSANAFISAGFPDDRISVVPHGVDRNVFNPIPRSSRDDAPFRFLFVGATIPRKGIDLMINAYFRTFKPHENVHLTIKDVNAHAFSGGTNKGPDIKKFANAPHLAPMTYVDETFTDREVAKLYREADCLVLPYRGEGFAMPVLEAMACGTAVMVTAGGATDDFVDDSVGWRIPSKRVPCPPNEPVPMVGTGWLLECDLGELERLMRYVFEHRDETRARGMAAAKRAAARTWDRAAELVEERLAILAEREPRPSRERDGRYRDAGIYEDTRTSGPIDGVLTELFRRITVDDPQYVEVTNGNEAALASVLAALQWNGTVVSSDGGIENLARLLESRGIRTGFDLLALSCENAAGVWETLSGLNPRVVACSNIPPSDFGRTASVLGYRRVTNAAQDAYAIFVRDDLAGIAGFVPDCAPGTVAR